MNGHSEPSSPIEDEDNKSNGIFPVITSESKFS